MNNQSAEKQLRSPRNGKIELLRFIFCVAVLMFHFCKYILGEPSLKDGIHLSFFAHGAIGVEFFFLVSGFLMAKSAYKQVEILKLPQDDKSLSKNYVQFIGRKFFSILPYHAVAFVMAFAAYVISKQMSTSKMIMYAAESLPNFLLIEMSGINLSNPNHIEWYISCMLLAMAILYPLCIRCYHRFTRFFSPLVAIFLLGYMQYTSGRLTGVSQWTGLCYKSLLRAIAEIALGATAFEICRYLQGLKLNKLQRVLLAIAEMACFVLIMLFILYTFESKIEVLVLFLLFILVIFAFSGVSYGSGVFNNKMCCYLGSISLPIYLAQLPAIYITTGFFGSSSTEKQLIIATVLSVLFTAIVKIFGDVLKKVFKPVKNKAS